MRSSRRQAPTGRGGVHARVGRAGGAGVFGVVGARGGAGASVSAALLASRLARRGPTVLVQIGTGPSVDTVLGLEGHPGLRWPDLTGARGALDADHLAANLMRWGRCAVLTTDDARPGPPPPDVLPDVFGALVVAHEFVVLDLDRAAVLGRDPAVRAEDGAEPVLDLLEACLGILIVVPRDVPGVAGARVLRDRLRGCSASLGLVVRGPGPGGLGAAEVEAALGVPVIASLPRARGLDARIDRGAGPALSGTADRVIVRLAERLA